MALNATVRQGDHDRIVLVGAGITLHLCLEAAGELARRGLAARVLDAYSVKPLDRDGLARAAAACGGRLLVVEDHWPAGGLGEAVAAEFADDATVLVRRLAVSGIPTSAPGPENLQHAGIDAGSIARAAQAFAAR
jgi:transketolase